MDLHIVRHCQIFQAHDLGSLPVGLGMPRGTGSVASISNKEAELEKLAELEEPAAIKEQAKHAALAKIIASKRARLQRARA
jgi:hypothetical protein